MLGVTYKTAWFMTHRIREAKKDVGAGPIGGEGKVVEADETYQGRRENPKPSPSRRGRPNLKKKPFDKRSIVALVERGGETRMFHIENATAAEIREVLVRNVRRDSELHTDESELYVRVGEEFASHYTVKHSASEYVRYEGDRTVHSNTVENVFSVLKRGVHGVYQHCGESHLHRYLAEFEFRYNRRTALGWNDQMRVNSIAEGIEGKRLTYQRLGDA
jgi:transposase-like protein